MADWDIGDLALCIGHKGWANAVTLKDTEGPRSGKVYEVRRLVMTADGTLYLGFSEWPRAAFHHRGFIKVTPPREMIEQERKAGVPA